MSIDITKLRAEKHEDNFVVLYHNDLPAVLLYIHCNTTRIVQKQSDISDFIADAFNEKVASIKLLQGVDFDKLEKELAEEEREKEKHDKT